MRLYSFLKGGGKSPGFRVQSPVAQRKPPGTHPEERSFPCIKACIQEFREPRQSLCPLPQITIAAMMLTTAYDTIMRYFFAAPTIWAVELNERLLVVITLLAGAHWSKWTSISRWTSSTTLCPDGGKKGARVLDLGRGDSFLRVFLLGGAAKHDYHLRWGGVRIGAFRLPYWVVYGLIPLGMAFDGFRVSLR